MNRTWVVSESLVRLAEAPALLSALGRATVLLILAWLAHGALAGRNPRWRVALWRATALGLAVIWALAAAPPLVTWRLAPRAQPHFAVRIEAERVPAVLEVEPDLRHEAAPEVSPPVRPGREVEVTRPMERSDSRTAAGLGHWLLASWLLGVTILTGRLALRLRRLGRIVRRSSAVPDWVLAEGRAIANRLGVTKGIRVLWSADVSTPCLTGMRRPLVLLPDRPAHGLERNDLRAILAHELAHVRTHDLAWNAVLHVASIGLWFHPLAWRVRGVHAAACDGVCDSVAADVLGDVAAYCRTLARLALAVSGGAPSHGLSMARTADVRRRIEFLQGRVFGPLSRTLVIPALVVACGLVLVVGGLGVTRGVATSAQAPARDPLAALSRDTIPPYELTVAGAGDPEGAPPSLVAILGDSRLKMQWMTADLVFTPDGRSLVGAGDLAIRFWDPATGDQQRVLRGHTDLVDALAISRDGTTLVSGSYDHTVKVWDLAAGKERLTLTGHLNLVESVAISPDGARIASGESPQVRLWDSADGRLVAVLEGHSDRVKGLAFSPDGKTLASGSDDGTIRLWDAATARNVKTLDRSRERFRALAFSPDGRTLAAGGYDHGLVLWDTATWTVRLQVPVEDRHGTDALAFTRDGRRLALVLGFAVRIIDTATGEVVRQFPKQRVGINALALSPDDATVATTGLMVTLWDTASGREKTPAVAGHHGSVEALAFSPDGTALATASQDGTVKLWDLAARRERLTLSGHDHFAQGVAFRPDGKALATLGFRPELILWELPSGRQLKQFQAEGDLSRQVAFSPDGRWLAAMSLSRNEGASATLWDVATGLRHSTVSAGDGTYLFSSDSKTIVFAGETGWQPRTRRLVVWDIAGKKAQRTIEGGLLPTQMRVAALSPDGRLVALAGWDRPGDGTSKPVVILWELAEGRPLYRLDFDQKQGATHLAFSPDGRTLVGIGRDGLARVWDPRNGTPRGTLRVGEPGFSVIRGLAFAPDSRHFAAAFGNGTARVFQLEAAPETVEPRAPLPVAEAKPEPPIDPWKRLIGQPAPEFRQIKAWAGGTPVALADLRGRFVLLHFWNVGSDLQLSRLMALHEEFADQGKGLAIIVVERDWGVSPAEFQDGVNTRSRKQLGNRLVPFRFALDGGGPTAIEGTDVKGPSATYAAYGILDSRDGWRLQPVNVLIGPDGKVLNAGMSVFSLRQELEAAMGVKARVPDWRQRFDDHYALAAGQVLKHIAPPYPPERSDFAFYSSPGGGDDPSWTYIFGWDGRLQRWSSASATSRLRDVIVRFGAGFRQAEIEGPRELLEMPVPGDWTVRQGTSKADLLKALETILASDLNQAVRFTEQEVEREVIVAQGRYRFHPLGDRPDERAVHLGTEDFPPHNGGGSSGTLPAMLDWLGNRINLLVIDESESPAGLSLQWRDHLADKTAEISAHTDAGRALLDRVLENLTRQTELTFHRQRRPVKSWVVSRIE